MIKKTIQAEPCNSSGRGLIKTGESGLVSLLSETARDAVSAVHAMSAQRANNADLLVLKGRIEEILSDSGAQSLRGVATNIIPLRCQGDPYDMGSITNLLDAVSECRDYVSSELSKRGVAHVENPRSFSGY